MQSLAALLWLTILGSLGFAFLRRAARLDRLERLAFGAPLGVVAGTLLLVPLASLFSLTTPLVLLVGLVSGACALWLWRGTTKRSESAPRTFGAALPLGAALLLLALIARWALLCAGALTMEPTGLWAGHLHLWGDWSQHLGDVACFAYGENFPPSHPRLAGSPLSYHYLTSVTVAALVKLGLPPWTGLSLHSFVFMVLTTLGVFAFARRLSGDFAIAAVAATLFFLGGGLGFWKSLEEMTRSQDGWETLWQHPWNRSAQTAANFRWLNVVLAHLMPQRATLYGLPLGLLILTLLLQGASHGGRRPFVLAGGVAGLLPLAHLGTMLSLAPLTPVLVLLFPRRGWIGFFLSWMLVGLPLLLLVQGGSAGALESLRFQLGWVAGADPWWWFWLKNLGLFAPLLVWALLDRKLLAADPRRFLIAFTFLFAIANLVLFQPWDWDNSKVLLYWYLGACVPVAALIVRAWRKGGGAWRFGVAAAVTSMLLSGTLEHLSQALGRDRHRMLSVEEVRFAEEVRRRTPARAMIVVAPRHNHPVTVLAGRRVVMGYPGWLWSQGFHYQRREAELRRMLALDEDAPRLFAAYGVDYVAIGPEERERWDADEEVFLRRYPRAIRVPPYSLYAVGRQ